MPPDRIPSWFLLSRSPLGWWVRHATRANQARLGIRSRKGQIKGMRREIRKFVLRGTIVLVVFIILVIAVVKH